MIQNGDAYSGSGGSYGEYLKKSLAEYVTFTECKRLLHQINSAQEKSGFKSVAILSDLPREGKSFAVLTIALGYATLLHKHVLIVDATHQTTGRSLYLDRLLGTLQPRGSGDEQAATGEVIDLVTTKSDEDAAPEGADFQIGSYVDSLRDHYDLILFDTCAMSKASKDNMDPVIVAKQADTAILISSAPSLYAENLDRIRRELKRWEINLLGTIYNNGGGR